MTHSPRHSSNTDRHDFGAVFREVRSYRGGMSQEELALLVGLSQHTVSTVEKDLRRLDKFARVVRVITALGIPAAALHFARTPPFGVEAGTVGWMDRGDRRDFHEAPAATALGIGATLELDRLRALLPVIGRNHHHTGSAPKTWPRSTRPPTPSAPRTTSTAVGWPATPRSRNWATC